MVVLKVLMGRGEHQMLYGRVVTGILIAQDVAVVPLVIVLPALAGGSDHVLADLALAALKATGIILAAYLAGVRAVPWRLGHATVTRTREVFVLGVVALALGTAVLTQIAGLSLAFGAFLAGLVVAESEYRTQAIAEVLPLRDLFAALFFVSVGMSGRVAVLTGLSLAQVGEFSFVLAKVGVDTGAIPSSLFDLTLGLALVTIVLTPALLSLAPPLLGALSRLPFVGDRWIDPVGDEPAVEGLRRHVVICGYGRAGRELAETLTRRGLRYVVVEYNPAIVRTLRERGVPVIYGDAANPVVLEHAQIGRATLLAALIPDVVSVEVVVRNARAMKNPSLHIVARVARAGDVERLRRAGASAIVQPEFEAGMEVIRLVLRRYGISDRELGHLVAGRRAVVYGLPFES